MLIYPEFDKVVAFTFFVKEQLFLNYVQSCYSQGTPGLLPCSLGGGVPLGSRKSTLLD